MDAAFELQSTRTPAVPPSLGRLRRSLPRCPTAVLGTQPSPGRLSQKRETPQAGWAKPLSGLVSF